MVLPPARNTMPALLAASGFSEIVYLMLVSAERGERSGTARRFCDSAGRGAAAGIGGGGGTVSAQALAHDFAGVERASYNDARRDAQVAPGAFR